MPFRVLKQHWRAIAPLRAIRHKVIRWKSSKANRPNLPAKLVSALADGPVALYLMLETLMGFGSTGRGDTRVITGADWKAAEQCAGKEFSDEERQIIRLLASGQSTPSIAKALGTNRSAIWRKVKRIREKLPPSVPAR